MGKFSKEFVPAIISKLGVSATPWGRLGVQAIQETFNAIYPELDYTITAGDAVEWLVRLVPSRLHTALY